MRSIKRGLNEACAHNACAQSRLRSIKIALNKSNIFLESFNFAMDGNPYPANLDYAICIKRQPGFCGINLGRVTPTDGVFKMNTNGNSNAEPFGRFCYDFTGVVNPNISSDYLAVLGASTFLGRYPVESAYFCGIFDGVNQVFPGIFSKYFINSNVF